MKLLFAKIHRHILQLWQSYWKTIKAKSESQPPLDMSEPQQIQVYMRKFVCGKVSYGLKAYDCLATRFELLLIARHMPWVRLDKK